MRAIVNVWTLVATCFSAGLWLAAATPARGDECQNYQNHTIPECFDGDGGTYEDPTCWCVACSDQGHSCTEDFVGTCTSWEDDGTGGGGRYVQIDTYNCWIEGGCSCDGTVDE
jgi:hypothetical protein